MRKFQKISKRRRRKYRRGKMNRRKTVFDYFYRKLMYESDKYSTEEKNWIFFYMANDYVPSIVIYTETEWKAFIVCNNADAKLRKILRKNPDINARYECPRDRLHYMCDYYVNNIRCVEKRMGYNR